MSKRPNDLALDEAALRRIATDLCQRFDEAEDLEQELRLVALEAERVGRPASRKWFYGVGRNLRRSKFRAEKTRRLHETAARHGKIEVPAADEVASRRELQQRLQALLAELPALQGEVCRLRYLEGLAPREIAQQLGITVEATKMRLKRALATLRERLSIDMPGGRERWFGVLSSLALPQESHALYASIGGLTWMTTVAALCVFALAGFFLLERQAESLPSTTPPASLSLRKRTRDDGEGMSAVTRAADERSSIAASTSEPSDSILAGYVFDVSSLGGEEPARRASGVEVRLTIDRGLSGLGYVGDLPGGGEDTPEVLVRTDTNGRFEFEKKHALEPGTRFALSVSASPTHSGDRKNATWPAAELIRLERTPFADLVGSVHTRDGQPLSDALVRITNHEGELGRGTTDENGKFRIATLKQSGAIQVELAGWKLLTPMDVRRHEGKAWESPRLMMAREARLRVRVLGPEAAPVSGMKVRVQPSSAEHLDSKAVNFHSGHSSETRATDEEGYAAFPSLWAKTKLQLNTSSVLGPHRFERHDQGRIVRDRVPGSQPLVLEPGENMLWELRLGMDRKVRGRVVDVSGTPVAGAFVDLLFDPKDLPSHPEVQADDEGRFELSLRSVHSTGLAMVRAMDASPWQMRTGRGDATPRVATQPVDFSRANEPLELTLSPTWAVRGRLVDGNGEGLQGIVFLRAREQEEGPTAHTGNSRRAHADKRDGSFILRGLAEGYYDLIAQSWDRQEVRVDRVAAGTSGLVIELSGEPEASVEHHITAPGYELDRTIVMFGDAHGSEVIGRGASTLRAFSRFSAPFGLPYDLRELFSGSAGLSIDGDPVTFTMSKREELRSIRLNPGVYWFGASGRATDGTLLAPIGTGPVHLSAGEHRLEFELTPLVPVRGRILGTAKDAEPCIALAWADGRLVALDTGDHERRTIHEIGGLGHFHFRGVPEGSYELHIASFGELEAGKLSYRQALNVVRGEPLELLIELP